MGIFISNTLCFRFAGNLCVEVPETVTPGSWRPHQRPEKDDLDQYIIDKTGKYVTASPWNQRLRIRLGYPLSVVRTN